MSYKVINYILDGVFFSIVSDKLGYLCVLTNVKWFNYKFDNIYVNVRFVEI